MDRFRRMSSQASPSPDDLEGRRLRDDYRRLAARRPLLAPHAEACFETLDTLGQGGMGRVLRIRDKRLGREAALKLLSKNDNPRSRQRFIREARVTARLAHPSIPPIHEAGETAEGQLYLLMKLIEGETLAELIAGAQRRFGEPRKAAIRELVETLIKVCEAMAFAHAQGIIHRDLKPENLMVGKFGEVMVMDWGIARDLAESFQTDHDFAARCGLAAFDETISASGEDRLTRGGAVLGTPGYMAPEQARGEDVDDRSDIFSLGVILTEALTGQDAIAGDSAQIKFVATVEGYIRGPRELSSRADRELDFIARRCLATDRERRWQSCQELRSALKAWLDGRPVPGYRYSPLARILRGVKRRPGAVVIALLLISLAATWPLFELEAKRRRLAELQVDLTARALAESQRVQESSRVEAERARRSLELFNEARDLARRGAPEARLKTVLRQAVRSGGRSAAALRAAAEVCAKAGLAAPQKAYLLEAVDRDPPGYEALLSLHLLETGGDLNEDSEYKRRLITAAEERGEENEFVLVSQAFNAYRRGDYPATIALCTRAEAYSGRLSFLYALRGASQGELKRDDEALEDYDKAIALGASAPQVFNNRGNIYRRRKQFPQALTDFDRAIALRPGYALALKNRGDIHNARGDWRRALLDYDRALASDPKLVAAYERRGYLYERKGDFEKALRDYSAFIACAPSLAPGYNNRGYLYMQHKDYGAARADFDRAIELDSRYPLAYHNRGLLSVRQRRFARAFADFDKAIDAAPDYARAHANRGLMHERLGRPGPALRDLKAALALTKNPEDAEQMRADIRRLEEQLKDR